MLRSVGKKGAILFTITDSMIDTMAVSLDVTIPDGDIRDRYRQLKSCLAAKQRYEVSRFR